MSRHVGTFTFIDGEWWVENTGAAYLDVESSSVTDVVSVPRLGATRLPASGSIRFPPVGYMLVFRIPEHPSPESPPLSGPLTVPMVQLAPRHIDFLVALAQPELVGDVTLVRCTLGEIARIWGVRPITVEKSLREVRDRLGRAGLLAQASGAGTGISDAVARIVVKAGLIGLDDYRWAALNDDHGPRTAASGPRFTGRQ